MIVPLADEAAAVRLMLELGIPPQEVAEMTMDARRRRAPMTCEWRTNLYGQSEPCESCGAEKWHVCTTLPLPRNEDTK